MKKIYVKPTIGQGFLLVESPLLTNSRIQTGDNISGTSSSHVEADARSGSFWDESE